MEKIGKVKWTENIIIIIWIFEKMYDVIQYDAKNWDTRKIEKLAFSIKNISKIPS